MKCTCGPSLLNLDPSCATHAEESVVDKETEHRNLEIILLRRQRNELIGARYASSERLQKAVITEMDESISEKLRSL